MKLFFLSVKNSNTVRLCWWVLSSLLLSPPVFAAEAIQATPISTTFSLSQEDLDITVCRGMDSVSFDLVQFEGCDFLNPPGWPMIPARLIRLALPEGFDVVGIRTIVKNCVELEGSFHLHPVQKPIPMSQAEPGAFTLPDETIYAIDEFMPGQAADLIGQGSLSGYRMAEIAIYPVQWNPKKGTLALSEIEVTLNLAPTREPGNIRIRTPRGEKLFRDSVRKLVLNPEQVPEKASRQVTASLDSRDDMVEYLIITDPDFVTQFQVLADWKMKKGLPSEVITTTWIYANYGGALDDDQTRIRECIKDYWQNKGLLYVLLGGDTHLLNPPQVPDRRAFAKSEDEGDEIPCDLYFADLDGTWDDDGDGIYGEYPEDGIDMYADIYIARASAGSAAEAALFVSKVLQYEGESTQQPINAAHATKMFFMGSVLETSADGKDLKEKIDEESVPSQFDPITKRYETDGNLTPALAISTMNEGQNIINHSGHGNGDSIQAGATYITKSGMNGLTNGQDYYILYSHSCYSANFVSNDCLAEKFLNAPNGGGFYIGNSRNGWNSLPFIGSLSPRLDRDFFRALFLVEFNYYPLGQAHQEAKHQRINAAKNNATERYIQYELNLLGDPEMPVWKNTPKTFSVLHHLAIDLSGSPFKVTVRSTGLPVEGATVCLWKGEEVYMVGETNASGIVYLSPAPTTVGSMFITITKPDFQPYENTVTVLEQTLAADGTTISAGTGGIINYTLTAGSGYGNRNYAMLATASGTVPGTSLPGGMAILPLNWDVVTDLVLQLANSVIFVNFIGTLNASGEATAQFNTWGPLSSSYIGLNLNFAYTFYNPFDLASNAVPVNIVP
ncbi:MAG: C25 family cysteine peptidase [Planctomycetota bacterium]